MFAPERDEEMAREKAYEEAVGSVPKPGTNSYKLVMVLLC